MHDRAADPIGAATNATAATNEIMILLSIEARITQVRLRVEENRSAAFMLSTSTLRTADPTGRAFSFAFLRHFAREKGYDFVIRKEL
jgi:hypothetical protein